MQRFLGKTVVVTGAGSGIGRATAQMFAAEGARVVVVDLKADAAQQTVEKILADHGTAMAQCCDISQDVQLQALFSAMASRFGTLHTLVNNAAEFLMKGSGEAEGVDWQMVFATNVIGAAICARYAVEHMDPMEGGAIINISSISGIIAEPNYATYCTSKAALRMLTRCMAIDYGGRNIRVNTVCPGAVDTPGLHRELERLGIRQDEFEKDLNNRQCLKGMLQPEDIARTILFLASGDATMITGSNFLVDGGYGARG